MKKWRKGKSWRRRACDASRQRGAPLLQARLPSGEMGIRLGSRPSSANAPFIGPVQGRGNTGSLGALSKLAYPSEGCTARVTRTTRELVVRARSANGANAPGRSPLLSPSFFSLQMHLHRFFSEYRLHFGKSVRVAQFIPRLEEKPAFVKTRVVAPEQPDSTTSCHGHHF